MKLTGIPPKVTTVVLVVVLVLTGCFKTTGKQSEGEEKESSAEAIKTFAYNATENLLIAINLPSYVQFSRNFSDELKQSFTKEDFEAFSAAVKQEHGLYSRNTSKQYVKEVKENEDGTVTFFIDIEFVRESQTDTRTVPFEITYKMVGEEPKITSLKLGDLTVAP